jgi:hypothetical protein
MNVSKQAHILVEEEWGRSRGHLQQQKEKQMMV